MTHPWMNTFWTGERAALYKADAQEIPLPDKSVHCVITSPPYWGLRDYGLGEWEGGDAECVHKTGRPGSARADGIVDAKKSPRNRDGAGGFNGACKKCGAWHQTAGIGLEPTLGEWVKNIVAVMREVRRVLRDDGTVWLNIGDAYSASSGQHGKRGLGNSEKQNSNVASQISINLDYDLPPKNLMGQPWRVAFALQDDGWLLRSAIVWHKPNPMPESTRDRPTSSYEMVFLLAKGGGPTFWTHQQDGYGSRTKPSRDYQVVNGERVNMWRSHDYFYDAEAIRTSWAESSVQRLAQPTFDSQKGGPKDPKAGNRSHRKVLENLKRRQPGGWATSPSYDEQDPRYQGRERGDSVALPHSGANARNVWRIPTQGRPDAHFATFPDALARRCILAGTSERGVCAECGAPWDRQVVKSTQLLQETNNSRKDGGDPNGRANNFRKDGYGRAVHDTQTLGWQPTCGHNSAPVPAIVLDPFVGSGTTVAVAQSLGRCGIGLDLNAEYLDIAVKRITSGKYDWTPEGGKP